MSNPTQAITTKNITDNIQKRLSEMQSSGEIAMPVGYSAGNALKQAWLQLQELKDKSQKPALEVCSKESIQNALLSMCIQGLNPAKKQCYLIVYGNQLQLTRSYFGTMAMTKRIPGVCDVRAQCVYKNDEFEAHINPMSGCVQITKHVPDWSARDNKSIVGAYCVIIANSGELIHLEYMNMDQIVQSWKQGAAKGASGAHVNFSDQMAKKTVINRACKYYANTTDDDISAMISAGDDDSRYPDAEPAQVVDYVVEDFTDAKETPTRQAKTQPEATSLEPDY